MRIASITAACSLTLILKFVFLCFLVLNHCHELFKICLISYRILELMMYYILASFFEATALISIISSSSLGCSLGGINHWIMEWISKYSIRVFQLTIIHIRSHLQHLALIHFHLLFSLIPACKMRSANLTIITLGSFFQKHSRGVLPCRWVIRLSFFNSISLIIRIEGCFYELRTIFRILGYWIVNIILRLNILVVAMLIVLSSRSRIRLNELIIWFRFSLVKYWQTSQIYLILMRTVIYGLLKLLLLILTDYKGGFASKNY